MRRAISESTRLFGDARANGRTELLPMSERSGKYQDFSIELWKEVETLNSTALDFFRYLFVNCTGFREHIFSRYYHRG
jgi:hypothetical protein